MTDYVINGIVLPQPTSGHWMQRRPVDIQGDNRPVYAAPREFELRWNIRDYGDWEVLVVAFNQLQSTGTATVFIPAYPTATGVAFAFREYSGATLGEPAIGPFFAEEFPTDIALVIGNLITE